MPKFTKVHLNEALATVSSLKRGMGIPDHPTKKDAFIDEQIHIYTSDRDTAALMGELLYRYGGGPREKFYNAHPEKLTIRDTVRVEELPEGGFDSSMHIPWPEHFKKAWDKMIAKHIASDRTFTR